MQQKECFSARTLALSVAAAELGRAILGAGKQGSVRSIVLESVLAAVVLVCLSALAGANAARLSRPGFGTRCVCGGFLLWYLAELVRTAGLIQKICWEQFSSMAFWGLLPLCLWAGWSLGPSLLERMASVLWWLMLIGAAFCIAGLLNQLQWQRLVASERSFSLVFPDAFLYPEYFSFPLLCAGRNNTVQSKKTLLFLPVISAVITSGYALGFAMLFGAPQSAENAGYPGVELLRAWSFGGISRFDAAFLLLWLAAAFFRFCFLVRAARLLCERLAERPRPSGSAGAEAAR